MNRRHLTLATLLGLGLSAPGGVSAEPMFLSKQYTRCTSCHFSPTGGGLLTPYGRALSREELSTTGQQSRIPSEQDFLYGVLGKRTGRFSLGFEFRPARLNIDFEGGSFYRRFVMNTDITAAFREGPWTAYAEVGRQGRTGRRVYKSFEHWVSYQREKGLGIRVGRFLPAFGVRVPDHSAFTRTPLGLNTMDQIYGIEATHTSERRLIQVSLGPGRADSVTANDARRASLATVRAQYDFSSTRSLVVSGLVRGRSDVTAAERVAGVAYGIAPSKRISIWTEANARFIRGVEGRSYLLGNESSYEVYRGVWAKVAPQFRTTPGDSAGGTVRLGLGLDVLPRTHWNVSLNYYRDKDRRSDRVTKTLLAQLFIYL